MGHGQGGHGQGESRGSGRGFSRYLLGILQVRKSTGLWQPLQGSGGWHSQGGGTVVAASGRPAACVCVQGARDYDSRCRGAEGGWVGQRAVKNYGYVACPHSGCAGGMGGCSRCPLSARAQRFELGTAGGFEVGIR